MNEFRRDFSSDRVILHVDMNNFYASVETLYNPSLKDIPMAVGGDKESRHGIVLAKNMLAKKAGVQTGEALWQAKQKCPDLEFCPAHYDRYKKYSLLARHIYMQYTDQVEAFGMDECWLDVTGSRMLFGSGMEIAEEIRERIKEELGLTVSIGVSWNKIFAKLGSDYKKPDAVTEFTRENYREKVWKLPVEDLLMVGRATERKLKKYGINTIGALANTDPDFLLKIFGKNGLMLSAFANGNDVSPVVTADFEREIKSIGNTATTPVDMTDDEDVKIMLYVLSESVAERLRENGLAATGVQISMRTADLYGYGCQCVTDFPVSDSESIFKFAFKLYKESGETRPLRNIGVRAIKLCEDVGSQCSLYPEERMSRRWAKLENTVEMLRDTYGRDSLVRGVFISNRALSRINPREDHTVHPVGFFSG